jgi:omega-6 fatty acid desaturase (delta-12 desaturase)
LHLPGILQWFTGNIGFHHVHHLNPRIPNYRLEECHNANVVFHSVPKLTLWAALRGLCHTLWDSELQRLVTIHSAVARSRSAT